VLEIKANICVEALRPVENAKIACVRRHFSALIKEVAFRAGDDFMSLWRVCEDIVRILSFFGETTARSKIIAF
jgi:restriction endonuclease